MKTIRDIRLYKSDIENVDGNSLPFCFGDKQLNVVIHRVVMKLRETDFSLGDFDHLYLNFTVCVPEGLIKPANRKTDHYYPWYRFYDIGVSKDLFNSLGITHNITLMISIIEQVLLQFFAPDENSKQTIKAAIMEAVTIGADMLMHFKEKKTVKNRAVIYLRYLDNAHYLPLLCIYDLDDNEILRKDLPSTIDLTYIGEIQLNSKKVVIKPRKNVFAKGIEPTTFYF